MDAPLGRYTGDVLFPLVRHFHKMRTHNDSPGLHFSSKFGFILTNTTTNILKKPCRDPQTLSHKWRAAQGRSKRGPTLAPRDCVSFIYSW